MSISFPKTWVANETVRAQDVRNNLDAMLDKQQNLSAADMQLAAGWVDTKHIMQGRYDSTRNVAVNVSGVFGGQNNGGINKNLSYASRWITNRAGSSSATPPRAFIHFTNITFDILRPATLFFQWAMVHQSNTDVDGTVGNTIIRASLNSPFITGTSVPHMVAEQANVSGLDVLIDGTNTTNGMILQDIPSQVLGYSIGLTAESTAGKCQNVSWAISLECFYM